MECVPESAVVAENVRSSCGTVAEPSIGLLWEVFTASVNPNAEVEKLRPPNAESMSPAALSWTMRSSPPEHARSLQIAAISAASARSREPRSPTIAKNPNRIPEVLFLMPPPFCDARFPTHRRRSASNAEATTSNGGARCQVRISLGIPAYLEWPGSAARRLMTTDLPHSGTLVAAPTVESGYQSRADEARNGERPLLYRYSCARIADHVPDICP